MSATASLRIPRADGALEHVSFGTTQPLSAPTGPITARTAYAAAHVVADPLADNTPGAPAVLDWDATLAFRRHLWSHGLGVAEAMDTAQRGMGLTWSATEELIKRSAAEAQECGGVIACGVGTDHLEVPATTLDEVVEAYTYQLGVVEGAGAIPILMASRHLAQLGQGPADYAEVYGRLLAQTSTPVILHWLGEMFDPALAGYWGSRDLDEAASSALEIIHQHADKIDGIKVSLLDAQREIAFRRALPDSVRLYTGDDFNYPELIRGDDVGHSDALLGIFDPIAPAAAAALHALEEGDLDRYEEIFAPTVPLAHHLFAAPTFHYKTGIVFLAWLAGRQDAFVMVGGMQSARSVVALAETARLADAAGLLPDPELAADRLRRFLAVAGVDA